MQSFNLKGFWGHHFKRFILPYAFVLIFLLLALFVFSPVVKKINLYDDELIAHRELEVKELAALSGRYIDLQRSNARIYQKIAKNPVNFDLLSYLEETSKKEGLAEKIASMKPMETGQDEISASLTLKNLTMEELTEYLETILNSGKAVLIKKAHIKAMDRGQKSLEVSLVISAVKATQMDAHTQPIT